MAFSTTDTTAVSDLIVVARKIRTLFDSRSRENGLTFARARTLLLLGRRPDMTQSELATELEVERPTMARLLDSMEKAGLVTREIGESDRRTRHIALTAEAQCHAGRLERLTRTVRAEVLEGVPAEDIAVVERVLARMLHNLHKACEK